jgi:hypothetical protein
VLFSSSTKREEIDVLYNEIRGLEDELKKIDPIKSYDDYIAVVSHLVSRLRHTSGLVRRARKRCRKRKILEQEN